MSRTDVIKVGQQFYIRAQSSLADARILSLLYNGTLGIFDRHGDILPVGLRTLESKTTQENSVF